MSVYKPGKSRFFHYDFVYKRRRYYGSTGCQVRSKAEAAEQKVRTDAALGLIDAPWSPAAYTLDDACGRWFEEHGKHRKDADDAARRLARLVALFPPRITLGDLDTAQVAAAIERRRGRLIRRGPKSKGKPPSNACVNRDVIACLRPVLRRAREHWMPAAKPGAPAPHPLPEIAWRELRLKEPPELVQVYTPDQLAAWTAECAELEALALDLMLTDGLRFGELFFAPAAYDASGPRLAWMKGRKGDVPHTVPLLERQATAIAARVGRAAAARLPHIWFEERRDRRGRAELVPLTYWMLAGRIERAARRAGIASPRLIHGARHHAGGRILRQTGNLKAVQRLLGHADIKSSARYAHLLEDDLRTTLEAMEPRNSPEPEAAPPARGNLTA